jgi:peptidyl-prolyl cis-trans isomerase D
MALMTSIRNNLSKLFAVLAFFFIIMIIFDWGLDLSGRRGRGNGNAEVLGKVNGQEIDYRQYSELVRRTLENQKKQTGVDPDEETERQVRAQVWTQLVDEILINKEIDRLGIEVTDQEIVDIVRGANPPEFLIAQFKDSTGTFRRDTYERAMMDPQNKAAWLQVEDAIRADQKRKKLQSLLLASIQVTESEVRQRFVDRNQTLDAQFVLFDANRMITDSMAQLSDDEIRRQYDEHPEDFKAKASRKLKYVMFSQVPSRDDSAMVEQELQVFLGQAKTGTDFVELAKTYSETPSSEAFFKHGELSRFKEAAVFAAKKGSIVGPVRDVDGIHLFKVLDERQGKEEFFRASHILLNVNGPDSVQVLQKARELLKQARGGANFEELAKANSQDFGSAPNGGELGWTPKGGWVTPFSNAAFNAKVGDIVGPVRTQFGYHIIKVTGKDRRELKLATLTMKVKASAQTVDAAFKQAEDFAYLTKEEGFDKAAEFSKYEVRETPEFTKGGMVPGVGLNESVNAFAFKSKIGTISSPMSVSNSIGVFMVTGEREEGLRPFEDVKTSVRATALREKKLELVRTKAEEFAKTIQSSSDLVAAAPKMEGVSANATGPFKPSDVVPMIGRDPKFVGVALSLKPGEISKAFAGFRGAFVIKLLSKTELDTTRYSVEKAGLRDQLLQEKRSRSLNEWQTALREKADIEDNRDQFYR